MDTQTLATVMACAASAGALAVIGFLRVNPGNIVLRFWAGAEISIALSVILFAALTPTSPVGHTFLFSFFLLTLMGAYSFFGAPLNWKKILSLTIGTYVVIVAALEITGLNLPRITFSMSCYTIFSVVTGRYLIIQSKRARSLTGFVFGLLFYVHALFYAARVYYSLFNLELGSLTLNALYLEGILVTILFPIGFVLLISERLLREKQEIEAPLAELAAGAASRDNDAFFREMMTTLSNFSRADYALIGLIRPDDTCWVDTKVALYQGAPMENFSYLLAGSPCEQVHDHGACLYPDRVAELFPEDTFLTEQNIRSYIGTPLADSNGQPIGVVALLFRHQLSADSSLSNLLKVYAGRASAELQRDQLQTKNSELVEDLQLINRQLKEEVESKEKVARELKLSNTAKTRFLSSMSHELRTPLNAILGFAQLLQMDQKEDANPEHSHHIEEILNAGLHLLALINDVLDLAKIDSGKVNLTLAPIPIKQIFSDAAAMVEPMARERLITIHTESLAKEQRTVLADATRLRQVLLNLLSNAVKYNRPQGSVTLSIEQPSDTTLKLLVSDTGLGIDDQMQTRLFQPFERAGEVSNTIQGTGIGLSISKQLVELMGGTIGVDSTIGEGSVFWIELPLSRPD